VGSKSVGTNPDETDRVCVRGRRGIFDNLFLRLIIRTAYTNKSFQKEDEIKNFILVAALITIVELVGLKGLLHLAGNVAALFLLWKGIEFASDLCKKIYYPREL